MENKGVLFFGRKNRWGLTVLSVLLFIVIAPIVSMAAMIPQVITLMPVAMMLLLGFVGPVSAVVCTGICVGICGTLFGAQGIAAAVLLFVPVFIVSAVLVEKRLPFWQSAGIGAATMFASLSAVVGMLTLSTGSDVVTAFTELVREMFTQMGGMTDTLLSLFAQMGLIAMPEGYNPALGTALSPQAREELVNRIAIILDMGLRLELPAQMAKGSVVAGVLGQALLRKSLLTRGIEVPYPRLRTWRLPKGWGRVLLGTIVIFFGAAQLVPERMNGTLYVFTQLFDLIFSVQGIAAFCFMLHKKGRGKGLRLLAIVGGLFFVRSLALALGVADQAMDITHRREEFGDKDNPYDPFGRKKE